MRGMRFVFLDASSHPKIWTLQSFGEVSQIVRMPDEDLHVHFKKAEVADTVRSPRFILNLARP